MKKPTPKQVRVLAVSAAALMLGASEATTTVGLAAGLVDSKSGPTKTSYNYNGGPGSYNYGSQPAVRPTVAVSSPVNNTVVTTSAVTVKGTSVHATYVTVYNATTYNSVNASPASSTSYSLNHWVATAYDLAPGTNILHIQASAYSYNGTLYSSVVSRVVLYGQEIGASVVGPGKMSPVLAGKPLIAGRQYKVTAAPTTGGKFLNWSISGAYTYSSTNSATLTFTMTPGMSLSANFTETTKPTLTITAPPKTVKDSRFTLTGTAKDNYFVEDVFVTLNGQPVTPTTVNNWANWSAPVYLQPGTNKFSAYAVNYYYGYSKTNYAVIVNQSPTMSPASLDGGFMTLTADPSGSQSEISFGLSAYADFDGSTNGESMGVYTYAQTSADGVEIVQQDAGGAPAVTIDATFADASSGSYTLNDGQGGQSSGTFQLTPAPGPAPQSVTGFVLYGADTGVSNYFGQGSFEYADGNGDTNSGSYVYSDLTPDTAWVTESGDAGTNSYFLHFAADGWAFDILNAGQVTTSDTFYLGVGPKVAPGLPPLSLDGYSLVGTKPKDSVVLTFDTATFALSSSSTNDPVGVGLYTFTPVDSKHGILQLDYLNPPGLSADDTALDLAFSSKTAATAAFNDGTYHFTLAKAANLLPASLSGHSITSKAGRTSIKTTFNLNAFTDNNGGAGTYTFAPYSAHAGLLTLTYTAGNDTGATLYVQLTFGAATSGAFLRTEAGTPAETGTFTFK